MITDTALNAAIAANTSYTLTDDVSVTTGIVVNSPITLDFAGHTVFMQGTPTGLYGAGSCAITVGTPLSGGAYDNVLLPTGSLPVVMNGFQGNTVSTNLALGDYLLYSPQVVTRTDGSFKNVAAELVSVTKSSGTWFELAVPPSRIGYDMILPVNVVRGVTIKNIGQMIGQVSGNYRSHGLSAQFCEGLQIDNCQIGTASVAALDLALCSMCALKDVTVGNMLGTAANGTWNGPTFGPGYGVSIERCNMTDIQGILSTGTVRHMIDVSSGSMYTHILDCLGSSWNGEFEQVMMSHGQDELWSVVDSCSLASVGIGEWGTDSWPAGGGGHIISGCRLGSVDAGTPTSQGATIHVAGSVYQSFTCHVPSMWVFEGDSTDGVTGA